MTPKTMARMARVREPIIMVHCPDCDNETDETFVRYTNIEEDLLGRDLVSFDCPNCKKNVKSFRFVRRGP